MAFGIDDAIFGGLILAGTALNIAGSRQKAAADRQMALMKAQDAERAADYAEGNLRLSEIQSEKEEKYVRFENALIEGRIRANYGASGVTMDGSPQDIIDQERAIGEANALNVRFKGVLERRAIRQERNNFRSQAAQLRYAAQYASDEGVMNAISAGISGGTTLLKAGGYGFGRRSTPSDLDV